MSIEDKKKLVWMCRRGTRELDQMTSYYLRHHYEHANVQEQNTFKRLLNLSDPELQNILIYGRTCDDQTINDLAKIIRNNYQP